MKTLKTLVFAFAALVGASAFAQAPASPVVSVPAAVHNVQHAHPGARPHVQRPMHRAHRPHYRHQAKRYHHGPRHHYAKPYRHMPRHHYHR